MNTKQVNAIVKTYENAIKTNNWDFPKGSNFTSALEIYELVMSGKTIYDFALQAVIKFGTITSGLMSFGGLQHVTATTRCAIRKGVFHAQEVTSKTKANLN